VVGLVGCFILSTLVSLSRGGMYATTGTISESTESYRISSSYGHTTPFHISVALPAGYRSAGNKRSRYPVIYVLDPEPVLFTTVVAASRSMAFYSSEQPDSFPKCIVVGVGYPRRTDENIEQYWERIRAMRARDYLPTAGSSAYESAGHSSEFLQFVADQLIPWVDTQFSTNTKQNCLLGSSFSGLFALYTLFKGPDVFRYYIIGSPSIWWDERVILQYENEVAAAHTPPTHPLNASIFMCVGALETTTMKTNAIQLAKRMRIAHPELTLQECTIKGETHHSIKPALVSRGLSFWARALQHQTQ